MKTYDQQGRLLGDSTALPVASDPAAADSGFTLPGITVTASRGSAIFDAFLKPPALYYTVAAVALFAWIIADPHHDGA